MINYSKSSKNVQNKQSFNDFLDFHVPIPVFLRMDFAQLSSHDPQNETSSHIWCQKPSLNKDEYYSLHPHHHLWLKFHTRGHVMKTEPASFSEEEMCLKASGLKWTWK